jgi:GNAT superfamily N-acetyltransferase
MHRPTAATAADAAITAATAGATGRTTFVVGPEPCTGDGPRWVMAQAESELVRRYGGLDESERAVVPEMFETPSGVFLVARAGRPLRPVGGVGLRSAGPGTGEVKRLWVDPVWRGRGMGRSLMDAVEDAARELGFGVVELATGDRQSEAVALYVSAGWERLHHDADGSPLPSWFLRFSKHVANEDPGAPRHG